MSKNEESISTEDRWKLESAFLDVAQDWIKGTNALPNQVASAYVAKVIEMGWTPPEPEPEVEWRRIPHFNAYEMNDNGDIRVKYTNGMLVPIHTIPDRTDQHRWRVDLNTDDGTMVTKDWWELMITVWGS